MSAALPARFSSFMVRHDAGISTREVITLSPTDLGDGDVIVRVSWSGVNYKDALAAQPEGKVARISPLVPGIDLAGTVIASSNPDIAVGLQVLAHGHGLGVSHHGGYSEIVALPSDWVIPLPEGLTAREAMTFGTAGFTAALSVDTLQARGLTPAAGPVLVTGATGGVGCIAVAILARLGYEVTASTGAAAAAEWLHELGAAAVIPRLDTPADSGPLGKQQWAGAVDCVGGDTLANVLRSVTYGGSVAASGNVGGASLSTTVFPFILRAVSLLGIDSVSCPPEQRRAIWSRLATDLKPAAVEQLVSRTVELAGVAQALEDIAAGTIRGRILVKLAG